MYLLEILCLSVFCQCWNRNMLSFHSLGCSFEHQSHLPSLLLPIILEWSLGISTLGIYTRLYQIYDAFRDSSPSSIQVLPVLIQNGNNIQCGLPVCEDTPPVLNVCFLQQAMRETAKKL